MTDEIELTMHDGKTGLYFTVCRDSETQWYVTAKAAYEAHPHKASPLPGFEGFYPSQKAAVQAVLDYMGKLACNLPHKPPAKRR